MGMKNYFMLGPTAAACVLLFASSGLYSIVAANPAEELKKLSVSITLLYLLLTATSFLTKQVDIYSRGVFVCAWLFSLVLTPLMREITRKVMGKQKWWGVHVMVVGAGPQTEQLLQRLTEDQSSGLKPVICVSDQFVPDGFYHGVRVAGSIALAPHLAKLYGIRHAIVALPQDEQPDFFRLLEQQGSPFSNVTIVPNFESIGSIWVTPIDVNGLLGLEIRQNLLVPGNRLIKRTFDLAFGFAFGLMSLPIIALAALIIKLVNPGPAFYSQIREGLGGAPIRIWKLRTMYNNAAELLSAHLESNDEAREEWSRYFKLRHDPRILPWIGKFLRRSSIDELPQLWNVLRGDMSLVGPRPFPEYHLDQFAEEFRNLRAKVVPGITGMWQISSRSDGDLAIQERQDTFYIRNWSLWVDMHILLRTVWVVAFGKGAY